MITLEEKDWKAISCVSTDEHDFLNYGERKFINYIIDMYVDCGLPIHLGVERAYDELHYVQSRLN